MLVTFKNPRIHAIFKDDMRLVGKLGADSVKRLKRRLDDLRAAKSLVELRHAPGSYRIVSERKGQFTCNIDASYQLAFESHKKPLLKNRHGEYDWSSVSGIAIVEITKYK
jgi:proteic killer suppression protein